MAVVYNINKSTGAYLNVVINANQLLYRACTCSQDHYTIQEYRKVHTLIEYII